MAISNADRENLLIKAEQAVIITGTINAAGDSLGGEIDAFFAQSVSCQISGTFTGTIVFEVSNDGVNWVTKQLVDAAGTVRTSLGATGLVSGDIGARRFRARASALTAGTPSIVIEYSPESQANQQGTQTVGVSFGKAEDAAISSGDQGVISLAQRGSATPTTTTSAAGDATTVLADDEGKQIPSGLGHPLTAWRTRVDLTTTSDAAIKAAAAAGLKNYVKTLILENTGAAAARVLFKDVSTTILSATIPAGSTLVIALDQPLANAAAATAFNAALGAAGTVTVTAVGYIAV